MLTGEGAGEERNADGICGLADVVVAVEKSYHNDKKEKTGRNGRMLPGLSAFFNP